MIDSIQPTNPEPATYPRVVCPEGLAKQQRMDNLGDEIALLAAQLDSGTYSLLTLIREFDQEDGWHQQGARSCAHWLNWRIGLGMGAAREHVRVARALELLPRISASMEKGELSYSKVRALTRIANPENEDELLMIAMSGTAQHVEALVRAWRQADRADENAEETLRHAARHLECYPDEDGMVVVRGRLSAEAGAALQEAIEAAAEQLYQEQRASDTADDTSAPQRRADALGRVAEAALSGGLDLGNAGDRYQVVVHVDEDVLHDEDTPSPPDGVAAFEDGQGVPAETARRLACDCSKVTMQHNRDGTTLDVGRKTRTIPTPLRRALIHRDRHCQFPGCTAKHCDAHHVHHWADGGETKIDNLVLLCRRHHRAVHEEGYKVEALPGGDFRFRRPDGTALPDAAARPVLEEDAIQALQRRLRARNIQIDAETNMPNWDGERFDLGWTLWHMYRPPRQSDN